MDTMSQMDERLWDYIDGSCPAAEQAMIKDLIDTNPQWKHRYEECLACHQALNAQEGDAPSLRFTRNVMEAIAPLRVAPATNTYLNRHIIRGIGGFFGVVIAAGLIFLLARLILGSDAGSVHDHPLRFQEPSVFHAWQDWLGRIDWNRIFSQDFVNIFIPVLVVLALAMLDLFLRRRNMNARTGKAHRK